ncbi:CCC motif membrane protein [Aestuariibaculum marinum]|uniref:Interferon-induced transmembrane protein n=1 Tax=Aestuariibaculum marinum TaxID=2683592 RepID=A0A8J6U3A2_9FLAO|nr:CCC motif membrane protein [Aestuariibaculum marinum]MBD0822897.1 hypothetical protein [Aestuariibaculum marinum]
MKKQLNPTLVYVLSIFGLLCCCFGGLGFVLSLPAFLIANSKVKNAELAPDDYEGNISAMKTAKIVALVILVINILYFVTTIYRIATVGWDEIMRQSQEIMEQIQNQ